MKEHKPMTKKGQHTYYMQIHRILSEKRQITKMIFINITAKEQKKERRRHSHLNATITKSLILKFSGAAMDFYMYPWCKCA